MASSDTEKIAAQVATLTKIFGTVPPAAMPAIVDCLLTSSQISPSSLFDHLLQLLWDLIEDIHKNHGKWGLLQPGYITSFTTVICHLLQNFGTYPDSLQSYVLRGFIPLLKVIHTNEHELLNQIAEQLCHVVIKCNKWEVIEETLVPFALRSVGLSIGMLHNGESTIYQWSGNLVDHGPKGLNGLDADESVELPTSWPLGISCHILASLLGAYLASQDAVQNELQGAENFAGKLLWDLCDLAVRMLSECQEYRSCALRLILPFILRAFVSHSSFQFFLCGKAYILSRDIFFWRIWKCCRSLFCLGPMERKDAYNILSLCLSLFLQREECENIDVCNGIEKHAVIAEPDFWDDIKRGLVDKEPFVRKQSLSILKMTLQIDHGRQYCDDISEMSSYKNSSTLGLTKRGKWAEEEAKSLGVGKICNVDEPQSSGLQRWNAFLLLYEMLEEYGTHLVEAAWNYQISLLVRVSVPHDSSSNDDSVAVHRTQMETSERIFNWLAVLWERGLCHENPQVRCLIMQSFLGIDWEGHGVSANLVPESFILGPFIQGLNDNVHHSDFGTNGVYSSKTIEDASKFLYQFCGHFCRRKQVAFISSLASLTKQESFGRAGLMALSVCIASSACQPQGSEMGSHKMVPLEFSTGSSLCNNDVNLLDILRVIVDSCKQHFNANYRLRVCEKILVAAVSVVCICNMPLETLMHFISAVGREFTDYGGYLRGKVQEWFSKCVDDCCRSNFNPEVRILNSLYDFPHKFIQHHHSPGYFIDYDDEDLESWVFEAQRWARLVFLAVSKQQQFEPIFKFIQNFGKKICREQNYVQWLPPKYLVILLCLVQELHIFKEKAANSAVKGKGTAKAGMSGTFEPLNSTEAATICEKFTNSFLCILEELISFSKSSCLIFWSDPMIIDALLPKHIKGKLGGPCHRRLSSSNTTAVLLAILSIKAVAIMSSWCLQFKNDNVLDAGLIYLWRFTWKVISLKCESEAGAEICIAAYEAVVPILDALASACSPHFFDLIKVKNVVLQEGEQKPLLDSLVHVFLQNINYLLSVSGLTRSRMAVLMDLKWCCLNSLLSIPYCTIKNGFDVGGVSFFFSSSSIKFIFKDLTESLETAGESSVLPMLRSVRLVLGFFASRSWRSVVPYCGYVDAEMMTQLVHSSWILHVNCNKRRVAQIAALLSSIVHCSVFGDDRMHEASNGSPGPFKWFIQKILDEGTKSPRTIRLAALHLTGLWLLNPKTIMYYIKELKLLALHGSVAFDEDFESELAENHDAREEVSLLAKSPDAELTKAFINTELYARVSVGVLFSKLADLAENSVHMKDNEDCLAAVQAGKSFLLELLDSVVNDKDLAKELYKKYSAIHRRKVRAWQMICILSQFVDDEVVHEVTSSLHLCLYRNNLPAVRQYLEIFAIQIYLRFPLLVEEQLNHIFRDYNMRPQALASYVFIAANIILHTTEELVRLRHLNSLLPPIVPLLTSHHHSLRCFTQLLVHKVLSKLMPDLGSSGSKPVPIEKRSFEDLKSYLAENIDCIRLRAGMEGFLDSFDPKTSATPAGIFTARDKGLEFECVPTSLLELVIAFLNDVRDDLRCTMANNNATLKNEQLAYGANGNGIEVTLKPEDERLHYQAPEITYLDFQKKVTVSKYEHQYSGASPILDNNGLSTPLLALEKEDQLLKQALQSRNLAMERIRASRQQFILVGSLIDRIPNLAGLARTCEVFKTAGLAVADASILHDKQFQLISVTAEKWVPIIEVPVPSMKVFLKNKKQQGFAILGLEQTANSIPLDKYTFPKKTVLVLGREKEGIPVDIIHILDGCIEIPQLGVVRSLNVHVSGAIALWEYTRQQRCNNSS